MRKPVMSSAGSGKELDSFIANHLICMLYFYILLLGQYIRSFSSHRKGIGVDKERLEKETQGGVDMFLLLGEVSFQIVVIFYFLFIIQSS